MMKKIVTAGAFALAAFGLVSASAAGLAIGGPGNNGQGHVQQSDHVNATCDSDGVVLTLEENGLGQVGRASVSSISNNCRQAQIQVRAFNAVGERIGSTNVIRIGGGDGGREWLTFSSPVDAQQIATTNVTIADQIR